MEVLTCCSALRAALYIGPWDRNDSIAFPSPHRCFVRVREEEGEKKKTQIHVSVNYLSDKPPPFSHLKFSLGRVSTLERNQAPAGPVSGGVVTDAEPTPSRASADPGEAAAAMCSAPHPPERASRGGSSHFAPTRGSNSEKFNSYRFHRLSPGPYVFP